MMCVKFFTGYAIESNRPKQKKEIEKDEQIQKLLNSEKELMRKNDRLGRLAFEAIEYLKKNNGAVRDS